MTSKPSGGWKVLGALALLILALAVAGGVAQAAAKDRALNTTPQGSPKAAATDRSGTYQPTAVRKIRKTELWAVVNSDGTLARGRAAKSSASLNNTGAYVVKFSQDVTQCAYIGTIGQPTTGSITNGQITVASRAGSPNGVFVQTSNGSGTNQNSPFHLAVLCKPA